MHPDKGGKHDDFVQLNEAYSVLSDKQKRKNYDTHGTANRHEPTLEEVADAKLNELFENLVNVIVSQPHLDLTINIVQKMENHLTENIIELESQKQNIIKHNQRLRKIQKRLSHKENEENPFLNILIGKRRNGINQYKSLKMNIQLLNVMNKKLENYEYKTEENSKVFVRSSTGLYTSGPVFQI